MERKGRKEGQVNSLPAASHLHYPLFKFCFINFFFFFWEGKSSFGWVGAKK